MSASTEPGRRVAWVSRLARLEPVAFSRWDAVHAALSVAIPTAIGAAIGHGADASLIALGALPAGRDPDTAPYNHSGRAVFDEAVLPLGAALLAELALRRPHATPPTRSPQEPR